jgi:hypothetical protein
MFFTPMWNWLKQQSQNSKRNRRLLRRSEGQHRLFLETLEDRTLLSISPLGTGGTGTDTNHIAPDLLSVYQRSTGQQVTNLAGTDSLFMYDSQGRIAVDISAQDMNQVLPGLQSLGFQVTASLPNFHMIEGYLPVSSILDTTQLVPDGLWGVTASYKPMTGAGSALSEGVNALEADRIQNGNPTGYDGTGVKVGILSDSYNNLGAAAADVASGDLPGVGNPDGFTTPVTVLQDEPSGGEDEGRAMLQIVHDVAPGATLGFATAFVGNQAGFAQNIKNLADPLQFGANIIADDVFYFAEPYWQEGPIGQAIDIVEAQGVAYFALAGNLGSQAYESTSVSFTSATISGISGSAQNYYDFGGGTTKQQITIGNNQQVSLGLQWDQPWYGLGTGVQTNINFYLLDDTTGNIVASSTQNNVTFQQPFQFLQYKNTSGSAHIYDVVIEKANAGPDPGRIKYVNFGANNYGPVTFDNFATNSPTLIPHAADTNAVAVAAAPFYQQHTPESYSSMGPATFLFDSSGNRLGTPQVVNKPDVMAIDGVSTTFFGDAAFKPNGFPTFFGTSAATPHAAAVAALVLQANPGFTPTQLYTRLENTADPNVSIDANSSNFNTTAGNVNLVGHGLVDAYRAINPSAPTPATPNYTDGFETGVLGSAWEVYDTGAGRTQVNTANTPASGAYDLTMDGLSDGWTEPILNEAILHINATGYTNLKLLFDQKSLNSNGDPMNSLPGSSFTGHYDGDGVSFSVDGVNWYPLISLTGGNTSSSYQTDNIDLSSSAATDGLALGSDVRIKFQQYDQNSFQFNGTFGQEGFVFDNVSVTGTPAVSISGISPSSGPASGGTAVTITGTGFTGATDVNFGSSDITAANFTVNGAGTQISLTSPGGAAGPVSVTVTAPGGTSNAGTFTYVAAPTVSSVTPGSGPASGGTAVTITGTGFTGATDVNFGSSDITAANFTVNGAGTQISLTSPGGAAGPVSVTVTAPGGTSNAGTFTYVAAPTVSSVTPGSGPASGGTAVTITGTGFTGATDVNFGSSDITAANFTVNGAGTQISLTSPGGAAGPVSVTVTAPGGTSNAGTFTYVAAPTVSSVTPGSGPASGGTAVTITGTGFTGATDVNFGSSDIKAANFTVVNDGKITLTSPGGAAGAVSVTVTTVGGTSNAGTFTYFTPAPTVTTQPQSVTTSVGSSVLFTAAATGFPPPTVQWQVSTDGGATFNDISGAVNTSLFVSGVTASMNGNQYRAFFTNTAGTAASNAAVLTVNSPPNVTTQPANATAVAGNNASFTAAASGSPPPTVQWQVSTNGGLSFSNYGGATSPTLNLTSVTTAMNGWRFRAVFSNTFGVATSNAATLTVTPAPMGPMVTTQPTSLSVAAGAPATFTAAASGSPAPTAQWQVSTNGGATFSNLSGATSTTLTLPSVTVGMNNYQYRAVFTNSQGSATTIAAILTVSAVPIAPTITTQPVSVAVASSSTATFTAGASGSPTPTVQWQVSINGGLTFSNLNGATSPTLNLLNVSVGMNNYKYRAVFTNIAGTATSNAATLSVNVVATVPSVTLNPKNQTATAGSMVQFTASANGTPVPSAQWQVSTDGGATFNNLSGATTTTLLLNGVTGAMNGNQYRAVFTSSAGNATTTAATLTVNVPPSVTTQPANATATAGNSASFTVAASGLPLPTVQWQVSTNGGATYTNIGGATTLTLNLPAVTTAMSGNKYRAVFTNAAGTITSNAATLTVNGVPAAPGITASPASQTVLAGTTVTFAASASGTPAPTVQWQVSTNGGATFSNLSGATSTTLTLPSVTVVMNNYQYRAVFTNSQGSATTSAATLSVSAVPIAPTITMQPVSVAVASGGTATFTAAASGTPAPTVQWQVSINGGLTFSNISGATNPMLTVPNVSAPMSGYRYRAVFTNSAGSATSNAAILSVTGSTSVPVVTTNPQNVTTTAGASVFFMAAATGTPAPTVQWQVSIDGGATFTNIPGATNTWLLLFGILASMNGYQYRAVFSNSAGNTPSDAAILTVI